jgi:putative intracellular protease/amidase
MEKREKRALIVVTSNDTFGPNGPKDKRTGWYLSEVTHVYYPLLEAGYAVEFASPKGGAAPLDESSRKLDAEDNRRFVEAGLLARLADTVAIGAVEPRRYAVVHFAGGHGTMWDFPGNPDIGRVAAGVYEQGGVVAAVCHGPAALVDVKLSDGTYLVAGKEVSAFTDDEERAVGLSEVVPFLLSSTLAKRGAVMRAADKWQSQVSVSQRLVTGQNPQSAKAVGLKLVEVATGPRT